MNRCKYRLIAQQILFIAIFVTHNDHSRPFHRAETSPTRRCDRHADRNRIRTRRKCIRCKRYSKDLYDQTTTRYQPLDRTRGFHSTS